MKQLVWTAVLAAALCICGSGAVFAAPQECIDRCVEIRDECQSNCASGADEKCEETCGTRYVNCVQKCSR